MDSNALNPSVGSIILGLLLVLILAGVIYVIGVWAVAQFRRGRLNEETDSSYPETPQSGADRQAVAEVHERAQTAEAMAPDPATDAVEREVHGRQQMRQAPSRSVRPADAAQAPDVEPDSDAPSTSASHPPRAPL
ncbi:MAG: hypothetical protein HGA45_06650 [Chloroflexales bacterium]|nr:hypothetical protein [Chloroflexales bacterium]